MDPGNATTAEPRRSQPTIASRRARLRRLAAGLGCHPDSGTEQPFPGRGWSALDDKTRSLVRLGALVASDAAPASYRCGVEVALAAGASVDEVVGTLIAVAPAVGLARLVSATPDVALAAGYDLDSALEGLSPISYDDRPRPRP